MHNHIKLFDSFRSKHSNEKTFFPILALGAYKFLGDMSEKYGKESKKKFGYHIPKEKRINASMVVDEVSINSLIKNVFDSGKDNDELHGYFHNFDFSLLPQGNAAVSLFHELSNLDFSDEESGKVFFDQMIDRYISYVGREGGQFSSPDSITEIVSRLVSTQRDVGAIYDPTAGIGSLLLKIGKGSKQKMCGQELNSTTYALLRINMLMNLIYPNRIDVVLGNTLFKPGHGEEEFDTVIGNPPLGLKLNLDKSDILLNSLKYGIPPKSKADFYFIQHMLKHLSNDGIMAVVVGTGVLFRGASEQRIRQAMIEDNILDAVIVLPNRLYQSTTIPATILIFKKNRTSMDVHFIDASEGFVRGSRQNTLSKEHIDNIVRLYAGGLTNDMSVKISVAAIQDKDYTRYPPKYIDKFSIKIERLKANYPKFTQDPFGDLIQEELFGDGLIVNDNSIYFSNIKFGFNLNKIVYEVDELEGEKENWYQIKFDDSVILAKYLTYFFKTELGSVYLDELQYSSGGYRGFSNKYLLRRKQLEAFPILIPKIDDQKNIVYAYEKLERIRNEISLIQDDLSLTPRNATQVSEQADDLLESIGKLSDTEHVLALARKGETGNGGAIELKETFHMCTEKKQHNHKDIKHSSLKNIAAFLNSDGGDLLIGVHDNGFITGIEVEFSKKIKTVDDYMLFFTGQVKNELGNQFRDYITSKLIDVSGKKVLWVRCKAAPVECRIKDPLTNKGTFYIRNNPEAQKLEGEELVSYIKDHFTNL